MLLFDASATTAPHFDSLTEIAASIGYPRSTLMARHYVEAFGATPRDDRRAHVQGRGLVQV